MGFFKSREQSLARHIVNLTGKTDIKIENSPETQEITFDFIGASAAKRRDRLVELAVELDDGCFSTPMDFERELRIGAGANVSTVVLNKNCYDKIQQHVQPLLAKAQTSLPLRPKKALPVTSFFGIKHENLETLNFDINADNALSITMTKYTRLSPEEETYVRSLGIHESLERGMRITVENTASTRNLLNVLRQLNIEPMGSVPSDAVTASVRPLWVMELQKLGESVKVVRIPRAKQTPLTRLLVPDAVVESVVSTLQKAKIRHQAGAIDSQSRAQMAETIPSGYQQIAILDNNAAKFLNKDSSHWALAA